MKIYLLVKDKIVIFDTEYVNVNNIIKGIYENKYKIPSDSVLRKYKITQQENINNISKLKYDIYPLYDIHTDDIYLVNKENIIKRIINNDYRFPDSLILKYLEGVLKKRLSDVDNVSRKQDIKFINYQIKKLSLNIEFLENFNIKIFHNRFIKLYDSLDNKEYINTTTCFKPTYDNIIPQFDYVEPYYDLKEMKTLGKIFNIDNEKNQCLEIIKRDIPVSKLIQHQNHILKHDGAGVLQYYSLLGSYKINYYLRELTKTSKYQDDILNNLAIGFANIIKSAPAFDNDIFLYRYISDDSFLSSLKPNDIYIDNGFLSCTRDYRMSMFGKNLMKIKVPKNKTGFALCVELFSHFKKEREVIIAPKTKLKLISKNQQKYNLDVVNLYEFEIIATEQNLEINPKNPIITKKVMNFNLGFTNFLSMKETYEEIKKKYFNEINQVDYFMNGEYRRLIFEEIKVSTVYSTYPYYAKHVEDNNAKNNTEYILYYIKDTQIIFFIEFVVFENESYLFVNMNDYNNYVVKTIHDEITNKEFIKFVKELARIFNIKHVILSCEFVGCYYNVIVAEDKINYLYNKPYSGNYNYEIYMYFKYKKIRFSEFSNIVPLFKKISFLDKYFNMSVDELIKYCTMYELIQYYKSQKEKISVRDFYIYLIENKCYFVQSLANAILIYERKINNDEENIFNSPFYKMIV